MILLPYFVITYVTWDISFDEISVSLTCLSFMSYERRGRRVSLSFSLSDVQGTTKNLLA